LNASLRHRSVETAPPFVRGFPFTSRRSISTIVANGAPVPLLRASTSGRYDLRKLKGHALIERDGARYAYRLTSKGVQVALLFLFFHKRLCGPLANSRFHHRPDPQHRPHSRLEAAYHRADKAIKHVVQLLTAA
jgi:hypothetical protein